MIPLNARDLEHPAAWDWGLRCGRSLHLSVEEDPRLADVSSVELRKECAAHGVRWRNASQGKHLTKAEMIERLAAV